MSKSYPNIRMRRNRSSEFIRNLIRETSFSTNDLIYPVFILPGKNKEESIESMPGKKRYSVDKLIPLLVESIKELSEKVEKLEEKNKELENGN